MRSNDTPGASTHQRLPPPRPRHVPAQTAIARADSPIGTALLTQASQPSVVGTVEFRFTRGSVENTNAPPPTGTLGAGQAVSTRTWLRAGSNVIDPVTTV